MENPTVTITILGAGGVIGNELAKRLAARSDRIRLVSRKPKPAPARFETMPADLANLDDTVKAVADSDVAVLLPGLEYDVKVWQELWPPIMSNAIEAAKRARAKLIFFDNVYMYGKVDGAMTEETPFNPCSRKGEIRAQIAGTLLNEMKSGNLTALIARAPDFYGPGARNGIPNVLVFDKLAQQSRPAWLVNNSARHSFTYTPDAAESLIHLIDSDAAWNQTWHLPAARDPLTGKEFIALAAKEFGNTAHHQVLSPLVLKIAGVFKRTIRELNEMLYQYRYDYIFDSSKFNRTFDFQPTSYVQGIHETAASYRR